MIRRRLLLLLIGIGSGCSRESSTATLNLAGDKRSSNVYTPTNEDTKNSDSEAKPKVWVPPLERYDKPNVEEKWFEPKLSDGGGQAIPCTTCRGRGQLSCHICIGSGQLSSPTGFQNNLGNWIQRYVPCMQCSGSGTKPCPTCSGKGYQVEKG